MTPARFDELLSLWQDGEASAPELAELESLLRSHPRYRRELVGSILLEVDLYGKYAKSEGAQAGRPSARPTPAQGFGNPPARKTRALHSFAAVLAVAVSLLAVSYFLIRFHAEEPPYRVVSGQVWVDGTPARSWAEGALFEVRGEVPAQLRLKDGSRLVLLPGSAGVIRGERDSARQGFELALGGGTFSVGPGPKDSIPDQGEPPLKPSGHQLPGGNTKPFRVETPVASVSSARAEFSVNLVAPPEGGARGRAPLPAVTVDILEGSAEVGYAGVRHVLRAGESVTYAPPAERVSASARGYEKLLREATFSLSAAIDKALRRASGIAVDAVLEDEDGRIIFSVSVAQGDKVREIELDAKTGALVDDKRDDDDRSKLAEASKLPLRVAIEAALEKVPGTAVEAESELKDGRPRAKVEILREARVFEVLVDLTTGAVTRMDAGDRSDGSEKK